MTTTFDTSFEKEITRYKNTSQAQRNYSYFYWPGAFKALFTTDQSRSQVVRQNNLNHLNVYFMIIIKQRETGSDTKREVLRRFLSDTNFLIPHHLNFWFLNSRTSDAWATWEQSRFHFEISQVFYTYWSEAIAFPWSLTRFPIKVFHSW